MTQSPERMELSSSKGREAVRVGVVGLGAMGLVHAAVLAESARADLVACADPSAAARAEAPAGVEPYADALELYARGDIEAVIIATPEAAHREPVEQALAAGIDVLVEKPLATRIEDADAMIEVARRTGRRLTVGHIVRFDPRYALLAERVARGELGKTVHLAARRCALAAEGRAASRRTSLLLYLGIHDLDVMQWLAGPVERVYAEGTNRGVIDISTVDSVAATLAFASGAVGTLDLSWALPNESGLEWDCGLSIIGTEACAYVDFRVGGLSIHSARGHEIPDTGYWPSIHGEPRGALRAQDEYFLASLRTQRSDVQTAEEARSALAAVLALDESLRVGRPVLVKDWCSNQRAHGSRTSPCAEAGDA